MTKYDNLVADGHTELQILPSDQFPSLPQGYWMLFVGGFTDREGAQAYCDGNGLSDPDLCFPRFFDPAAPAGG